MSAPKGKCPLCLSDNGVLQESHLTSAAIYRLLDSPDASNSNPWLITPRVAVQISREIKGHVLCRSCEQDLSRDGENWVIPRLATREGKFPLLEMLTPLAPDLEGDGIKVYAATRDPHILVNDLTRFGLGVFWKASVHSWRTGKDPSSVLRIDLGAYGEKLRRYLRGEVGFPQSVALGLVLNSCRTSRLLSIQPNEGSPSSGVRRFFFYVPGILFNLAIGEGVTSEEYAGCFCSNPLHPILVRDISNEVEDFGERIHLKARGAAAQGRKGR